MRRLRVDRVVVAGGKVTVYYTAANGALAATPSKRNFTFASKAEANAARLGAEAALSDEQLVAIALSVWIAVDPTASDTSLINGKVVSVDIDGRTSPVSVA